MIEATTQITGLFGLSSLGLVVFSLLSSLYLAKKLSNNTKLKP